MYLVVETYSDINDDYYTHFIELNKNDVYSSISHFVNHINYFQGQVVKKVYFSKDKLSNW